MMKLATLALAAVITGSCCDVPEESLALQLEGEWVNTWSTEEFRETLTIKAVESLSKRFALHFHFSADYGEPDFQDCAAVFVNKSLVLGQVHSRGQFVILTPEWEGGELVLAPYPELKLYNRDEAAARAVFRRVEEP